MSNSKENSRKVQVSRLWMIIVLFQLLQKLIFIDNPITLYMNLFFIHFSVDTAILKFIAIHRIKTNKLAASSQIEEIPYIFFRFYAILIPCNCVIF